MADLAKIKRNVAKMAAMNAPEGDIDGYIASEGVTIDDVRNFKAIPQTDSSPVSTAQSALNTAADVGKTTLSGLAKGAAATAMVIPDLINTAVAGPQLLGRGIAEKVSPMLGVEPQPRGEIWQPFYGSQDVTAPVAYEPKTMAGKIVDIPAQMAGGIAAAKTIQKIPGSALVQNQSSGAQPPAAKLDSAQTKQMAQAKFAEADAKGAQINPNSINSFVADVKRMMPQSPQAKALGGESVVTQAQKAVDDFVGKPMNFQAAKEVDETFGQLISGQFKEGRLTAEGRQLSMMQDKFRQAVAKDVPVEWREAQKLWSRSLALRDVERIFERASMTDNPAMSLKTGFRTLALSDSRMRGFKPEERALINQAAKQSATVEFLRNVGSRLGAVIGVGTGQNPAITAANYAGAKGARELANTMQGRRGEKVMQAIQRDITGAPAQTSSQVSPEIIKYSLTLAAQDILKRMSMGYQPSEEEAALVQQYGAQ